MSKYMDDYIASILARPKPTEPQPSPFNAYGMDCICGQWLRQSGEDTWTCDGQETRHDWKRHHHGWELLSTKTWDKETKSWT